MPEDFSRSLQALSLSSSSHANTVSDPPMPASPKATPPTPWMGSNPDAAALEQLPCEEVYESSAKSRRGAYGQSIALDEDGATSSSRMRRSPVLASSERRAIEPPHPRIAALRAAANVENLAPDAPLLQVLVAERSGRRPPIDQSEALKALASPSARSPAPKKFFREADFIASRTRSAGRKTTSPLGGSDPANEQRMDAAQ